MPEIELSSPVVINPNFKRTIGDLRLFARLSLLEREPALATELLPDVIDLLDRAVIDGVLQRPADEIWLILGEVTRQLQPKNSETGS